MSRYGNTTHTPKCCKGCFYRTIANGNGVSTCDYCYVTGKLRGTTPEECTHYKPKPKKKKNAFETMEEEINEII